MFHGPRTWSHFPVQLATVFLALIVAASGLGCVSSRSPEQIANDRAAVLGTWEYRAEGVSVLQRGTFRVYKEGEALFGQFRDSWRGTFKVKISLSGSQLSFEVDRLRISGQVLDGEFTGSIRRPLYDVSRSSSDPRPQGYFEAERIQRSANQDNRTSYGCTSLLRESAYTCSSLSEN